MHLTLGHSPDPDDAFMFYALAKNKIPMGDYTFEHILQDIETLNQRAARLELDITAFSIHAYASMTDKYALLPSGASMGDNYGPRLVALHPFSKGELLTRRIAIPGVQTSAALALMLYLDRPLSELNTVVIPFDEIFQAVKAGQAEVGLIIHEGQLTYQTEGFTLLEDLGAWWYRETGGLPLPLGGNGIRRSLGTERHRELNKILTASIAYALDPANRKEAVQHSLAFGRGLDHALADEFVGMYVNQLTLDYGERGRAGIREFLGRAASRGFIPRDIEIQFVQ
jgi:1,4-dihydroxy-6-naphthoate synthase